MQRIRIQWFLALGLLWATVQAISCAPPPCGPDDKVSQLTLNPNDSNCQYDCECNNQNFEGYCKSGKCVALERISCKVKSRKQTCILQFPPPDGETCKYGVQECRPDYLTTQRWGDCEPFKEEKETTQALCGDAIDNDCDGKVDKADADCSEFCNPGQIRPCYTGDKKTQNQGSCATGIQRCNGSEGRWFKECVGEVLPGKEVCNGRDEDCDGQVDEGLKNCTCDKPGEKEACYTGPEKTQNKGSCKNGIRTCGKNKRWGKCAGQVLPREEKCDGKVDENCDGLIDENCPCEGDDSRFCGSGLGNCLEGVQRCENSRWSSTCYAQKQASSEICDGEDNDCDGEIDEKLVRDCKTDCGEGQATCEQGAWKCDAQEPKNEECNGKDDDCDGTVDNGLTRACTDACGGDGISACIKGKWSTCVSATFRKEECNGQDDNCDGNVDEGLFRECQASCGVGVEFCLKGKWSSCTGGQKKPEVCNGLDDDCDGTVDNAPTDVGQPCQLANPQGNCKTGTITGCNKGKPVCTGGGGTPEVCNGQDDDCNGKIDDNLTDQGKACNLANPQGNCKTGTITGCSNGKPICKGGGSPEVCNGQDDDCNGTIDDNVTELGKSCTLANPQGSCTTGTITGCNSGKAVCQVKPTPEICDGKDNNCDGNIDEGIDLCMSVIAGTGAPGFKDGDALTAQLNGPRGLALSIIDGSIYITDSGNNRIRRLFQGQLTTLAGTGTSGKADGNFSGATFAFPIGVALDETGILYVGEAVNQDQYRELNLTTKKVTTVKPTRRIGVASGLAWFSGKLFSVDPSTHSVFQMQGAGSASVLTGGSLKRGYLDGTFQQAQFNGPNSIQADNLKGGLVVADTANHRIRLLDLNSATGKVTTLAGNGTAGSKDGAATTVAQFRLPRGVTSNGNSYYVVGENHCVREIKNGQVKTIAGLCGVSGSSLGIGKNARLKSPTRVIVDGTGNLLIADTGNNRICRLTLPKGP